MGRWRFSCGLLLVMACSLAVSLAQTTGTVQGTTTDPGGEALPGVTVEIRSQSLQGVRRTITQADGRYRFPSLSPGVYTVTASLEGLTKVQKSAIVTLDSTAVADFRLKLSASAEVTVTGGAPLVDPTSTTTGTNYSASVIEELPLGRNYADVAFLQPGVQKDVGVTQGRSLPISIYGSTSAENLFLIDGVNTTSVIKGIQGKDMNSEFVQEVEVKTGGYQAEYGRSTGGVINVLTKSGGNDFHGGVFGYFNDTGMRADPVDEFDTAPYSESGDAQFANSILSKDVRQEWGLYLGGYFLKDTMWFFGGYDRVQINQSMQTLDPENSDTFGLEFPNAYVQNKYSGKLTLNPLQSTSIVGTVFSDAQTQLGVLTTPLSTIASTYAGRQDMGGTDYGARLSHLFGSFGIFTFQYAQHTDRYVTHPEGVHRPAIRDFTVSQNLAFFTTDVSPGNATYPPGFGLVQGTTINNESRRQAYSGAFTTYLGNHEVRVGADYQNDETLGSSYYTGESLISVRPCLDRPRYTCDLTKAPTWLNANGEIVQVFFQHDLLAAGTEDDYRIIPASPFHVPTKRYGAFVQDQWRILPSLTANLGVRYDTESLYGLDPITGPFKAFSLTNQWAPRVGLVWDFIGDGTSKLYASAGRFYYAIPTDLNVRTYTANSAVQTYNYDIASNVQDEAAPRPQRIQGGSASGKPVDPGTHAAFQDELTFGMEKALDPTFSLGLKGIYRTLAGTLEDRCDLNPQVGPDCPDCSPSLCAISNPGGDGPVASGGYPTCNGSGNPTDPTAGLCGTAAGSGQPYGPAKRYFRGIELVANKRISNTLWAQLSFLYSSLTGNYSGAVREASGQTDPGINADFDYYQFAYNAYGRLELDRPVQARIDALYNAEFGLSAGLGFYVRSGVPISKLGWFNDFYLNSLNLNTRGSNGRTPTDYDLNLLVSYAVNLGSVTITPMAYLYNVINRQTVIWVNQDFNAGGTFVTNEESPFYGQAGVEPGTDSCPASAAAPCTDNPDYLKAYPRGRTNPRLFRAAIKVSF